MATPLRTIITNDKSFYWETNRFWRVKMKDQSNINFSTNLKNTFEVEMDLSVYYIGVVLMQEGKLMWYHYKMFHGRVLKYPTYDKELYAFIQYVKKWKHYLMANETIIYTND